MKHMKRALLVKIVVMLLIATCLVAVLHLHNQEEIACMVIEQEALRLEVTFEDLDRLSFSGELIDGKGDVTSHSYTGILLRDLLEDKGIDLSQLSGITVTSADNYSVQFTMEEILADNKVYIAVTADGKAIEGIDPDTEGLQVIVFGDPNSKRCVRYAQRITLQLI